MAKPLLLTISLLISNRPDTVRKCLDSVQPLLKAVPSELILTDTGCGEEVRGIIEEYTDNIIDFEWCKDFAKARNVGLKKAKGQWFLFLDDDEWFDDVSELVHFFTSGEHKKYAYATYVQRNYLDREGTLYTDLPVARIIRLNPKVEFMYSIHECFNCVPGEIKQFQAFVHHYGYAYATLGEAVAHAARNIELLLVEHENHPRNMKHTLQLVQEYNTINQYGESLKFSLEGIELSRTGPVELDFCLNSLFGNVVDCYMNQDKIDEAIESGEKYLAEEKLDPLIIAMIDGLLVRAYLRKNEPEKCFEKIVDYEKIYKHYSKHAEDYIGFVTTVNSNCFESRNRSMVLGFGVQAAIAIKEAPRALEWFHSIDLDSEKAFVNNEMVMSILNRMAQIGVEEYGGSEGEDKESVHEKTRKEMAALEEMCNVLLKRKDMEGFIARTILDKFGTEEELSAFAGAESELWAFALARVLKGVDREKNALAVWKRMDESVGCIRKYHMMEALQSAGCDIGRVLSQIPFSTWEKELGRIDDMGWWQQWFELLPDSEELKRLEWKRVVLYRQLIKAAKAAEDGGESEEVDSSLWEYSIVTMSLCEKIYRSEILQKSRDVMPAEYHVAFLINDLKENLEADQISESVELIRQIKELQPRLVGAMKPILVKLQKKSREDADERKVVTNEMQMLGMQIKLKIRTLMQGGHREEALSVAKQLAGLLPGDKELQNMIKQLEKTEA